MARKIQNKKKNGAKIKKTGKFKYKINKQTNNRK